MASKRVSITMDESQLDAVRAIRNSGAAASLSGFVQHAVAVALDDVAGWRVLLGQALEATGGPLTKSERARADAILNGRSG